MKFLATALSVLLTTSITAALRGNKDTHDDAAAIEKDNRVISTIEAFVIDTMEDDFDDGHSRHLNPQDTFKTKGTFNTIAVMVTDKDGSQPSISNFDMFSSLYSNDVSFKNTLEGCSYDNVMINPVITSPFQLLPGVIDMTIDIAVTVEGNGQSTTVLFDSVRNKMIEMYGVDYLDIFDLILYCVPRGSVRDDGTSWGSLTQPNNRQGIFMQGASCGNLEILMPQFGYGMGLGFDNTGAMSVSDAPLRCYNSANSYQLDWYTGQYGKFNELELLNMNNDQIDRMIKLDGIAAYRNDGLNSVIFKDSFVSLRIENTDGNDYYIGFNWAFGINSDTQTGPNKVHLLEKINGVGPYERGESLLVTTLEPFAAYTFRVGSSAVTLKTAGSYGVGSTLISLSARSLIESIEVPTLISNGPQTFDLNNDDDRDYTGDGIVKVRIEHQGYDGGNDWYIQRAEEDPKVQLVKKSNGPYEEGEWTLVTTLGEEEEYEWSIDDNLVTLKMNFFEASVSGYVPYSITLSATETPSAAPTVGPTNEPTSTPSSKPSAAPSVGSTLSESPTKGPTVEPTSAPTSMPIDCTDNPKEKFDIIVDGQTKTKDCDWVESKKKAKRKEYCMMTVEVSGNSTNLTNICRKTCGMVGKGACAYLTAEPTSAPTSSPTAGPTSAPTSSPTAGSTNEPSSTPTLDCDDHPTKVFNIDVDGTVKTKDCAWVASKKKAKRKEYCKMKVDVNGNNKKLPTICKETCGMVGKGVCKHLNS